MPQNNVSLWNIIDVIFIIGFILFFLMFFLRKKYYKIGVIYLVFSSIFTIICVLDFFFNLPLAKAIVYLATISGVMLLMNIYGPELKTAFINLTKHSDKKYSHEENVSDEELRRTANEIIKSCQNMSKNRVGALILIAPSSAPNHILETGVKLDALVSSQIIESIFNTSAPIHDGAIVIKENKILAAGCFLPLTQSPEAANRLGTRHRAAIGISEESDIISIVVSEESGIMSYAKSGELKRYLTPDRLKDVLYEIFDIKIQLRAKNRYV